MFDPWAIDPDMFADMMAELADHPDDCTCDTCTFVNLIPTILDAAGVE